MKEIHFVHISDIHFRLDWEENQGKVLNAFFEDLMTQIKQLAPAIVYFILSGDVVHAGGSNAQYESALMRFNEELDKMSIDRSKRICIPGNHDVDIGYIGNHCVEHNGVVMQPLSETDFNNYIQSSPPLIREKFGNYLKFELQFSDYHTTDIGGKGIVLSESVGLYCLNTALFSSGGYKGTNDEHKLAVDTRALHRWLNECACPVKVLVMHHPLSWLCTWAQQELKNIIETRFQLVFSGHEHTQDLFHSVKESGSLVQCSAPPLFTHKADELGYAIVSVSATGVSKVSYRQWTKRGAFVRGVNFTNNEEGYIEIQRSEQKEATKFDVRRMETEVLLKRKLDESLRIFSSQPVFWIDRLLSDSPPKRLSDSKQINKATPAIDLLTISFDLVVKAPPQFGLTCLSRYIAYQAWKSKRQTWLHLDFEELKLHSLEKEIQRELQELYLCNSSPTFIAIDNWDKSQKHASKFLQKVKSLYPECRIILFDRINDNEFVGEHDSATEGFSTLYLMPLLRGDMRNAVVEYNSQVAIGDDEIILKKITVDLDVLNVHRTPLNCLTLLKAFETNFDESPVNRAELIHNVLYVLFQVDKLPTYKSKPDLKDCEFVLGYFCTRIVQQKTSPSFTREHFIQELSRYCALKTVGLEVSLVFDVLYNNNIIIQKSDQFSFRFAYWVYYFAALHIKHNPEFSEFIFSEKRYTAFPEIIEFYTGSDRTRADALKILATDLAAINQAVDDRVGLPGTMNPYQQLGWKPTPAVIEQMNASLGEDVQGSKLPIEVKDQYEDLNYDVSRPSNQGIRAIFKDYNLNFLWAAAQCAARALRNSDYTDTELKEELLTQISESWALISKVLIAISPILAEKRMADFDGQGFVLIGNNWPSDANNRWIAVLSEVSSNVVRWFKHDISSQKMGPLLFKTFEAQTDPLKKHQLALIIARERPKHWKGAIQKYIEDLHKNSYYLYDMFNCLRSSLDYESLTVTEIREAEALMKAALSKHDYGTTAKANRYDESWEKIKKLDQN